MGKLLEWIDVNCVACSIELLFSYVQYVFTLLYQCFVLYSGNYNFILYLLRLIN